MKVAVDRVLFCRLTTSNAEAFLGGNRGEYDLRLGTLSVFATFADGVPEESPTALGGWTKHLDIEPFDGPSPVPAQQLRMRYMGEGSQRKDTYIASQSSSPYPLWAPARARPGAAVAADLEGDRALLIRDVNGRFHARWLRREDVSSLPSQLRATVTTTEKGVCVVPTSGPGPSPLVQDVISALRRHHNVLLFGPPGTGKTHLVTQVRKHFGGSGVYLDTAAETDPLSADIGDAVFEAWATFHQSYSYEDFLIGLRPEPNDGGGFRLVPRPGLLLEAAEWARQPGRESLLIIDEINRGNVSRIFGEFITLMEPDKRLDDDGAETDQTVRVRLPFINDGDQVGVSLPGQDPATVPTPFTMPRRVYTLATMNSVDKSVAPLDAALRRRFHVLPIFPRLDKFRDRLGLDSRQLTRTDVPETPTTSEEVRWAAVALLEGLNKRISLFLGADFQLGEWFLAPVLAASTDEESRAALADVWRTAVLPQLEDYFVGRSEQLEKVLGDPRKDEPALIVDVPEPAFEELGAVRSLRGNPAADDPTVLAFLAAVARSGLAIPPTAPNEVPVVGGDGPP